MRINYLRALLLLLVLPGLAEAAGRQGGSPYVGEMLCKLIGWLASDLVKGLTILALILVVVGGLFGKMSAGMVMMMLVGLAVMLSAPYLLADSEGSWNREDCFPNKSRWEEKAPVIERFDIVVIGDASLGEAGEGELRPFVSEMERLLGQYHYTAKIIDRSEPGMTLEQAYVRLDELLPSRASIVILALGREDLREGASARAIEKRMGKLLGALNARGVRVLMAGVRPVAGTDPETAVAFASLYPAMAGRYRAYLYPLLLQGVEEDKGLMAAGEGKPNAAGGRKLAENLFPYLKNLMDAMRRG